MRKYTVAGRVVYDRKPTLFTVKDLLRIARSINPIDIDDCDMMRNFVNHVVGMHNYSDCGEDFHFQLTRIAPPAQADPDEEDEEFTVFEESGGGETGGGGATR